MMRCSSHTLDDGEWLPAQQKIDGGPSVLYDAVAVIASEEGARLLLKDGPTRDFISEAFSHCKYINYTEEAATLLQTAGIAENLDEGCVLLEANADDFVGMLGQLCVGPRELNMDADA
jgi:catalase